MKPSPQQHASLPFAALQPTSDAHTSPSHHHLFPPTRHSFAVTPPSSTTTACPPRNRHRLLSLFHTLSQAAVSHFDSDTEREARRGGFRLRSVTFDLPATNQVVIHPSLTTIQPPCLDTVASSIPSRPSRPIHARIAPCHERLALVTACGSGTFICATPFPPFPRLTPQSADAHCAEPRTSPVRLD